MQTSWKARAERGLTARQFIDAHVRWIEQYEREGWEAYMLTFMFNHLGGAAGTQARAMEAALEQAHGTLTKRSLRKPLAPDQVGRRPFWISAPDYPVAKRSKSTASDVTVNGGRHVHTIALQHPNTRINTDLVDHFELEQHRYCGQDRPIRRIDVRRITHDMEIVVDYVTKALKSGRIADDEIFWLPLSSRDLRKVTGPSSAAVG